MPRVRSLKAVLVRTVLPAVGAAYLIASFLLPTAPALGQSEAQQQGPAWYSLSTSSELRYDAEEPLELGDAFLDLTPLLDDLTGFGETIQVLVAISVQVPDDDGGMITETARLADPADLQISVAASIQIEKKNSTKEKVVARLKGQLDEDGELMASSNFKARKLKRAKDNLIFFTIEDIQNVGVGPGTDDIDVPADTKARITYIVLRPELDEEEGNGGSR